MTNDERDDADIDVAATIIETIFAIMSPANSEALSDEERLIRNLRLREALRETKKYDPIDDNTEWTG